MAGILDSKSRILDTTILPTGREQAAFGHMQIRYVTFTDRHAFYDVSGTNETGKFADDAGDRIYFEAARRYQDLLCIETNANGNIQFPYNEPDEGVGGLGFHNLAIFNETVAYSGSYPTGSIVDPLVGTLQEEMMRSLNNNYGQQHFLATKDMFTLSNKFLLSTGTIGFQFTCGIDPDVDANNANFPNFDKTPLNKNIEDIPKPWEDPRFYHLPNFLFLPQINKLPPGARMQRVLPYILLNKNLMGVDDFNLISEEAAKAANLYNDQKTFIQVHKGDLGTGMASEYGEFAGHRAVNSVAAIIRQKTVDPADPDFGPTSNTPESAIGETAFLFADTDIKDFHAAKMAFMKTWPDLLSSKAANATYTLSQVKDEINAISSPFSVIGDMVEFIETSKNNNIVMQVFESCSPTTETGSPIQKLAVIDGGELYDNNSFGTNQRIFHVGKMFTSIGDKVPRFVRIFTFLFHSSDSSRSTVGNTSTALESFGAGKQKKAREWLVDLLKNDEGKSPQG